MAIADLMERLTLQSKRIRDLEQEKRDAGCGRRSSRAWSCRRGRSPRAQTCERAGREAIWRRQRMDLLEQGVDMDVQCEADRAGAALAEVGRLERELAAVKEVAEAARVNQRRTRR